MTPIHHPIRDLPIHATQAWREGIDSAPHDGTVVLAYRPDAGVFTAHYVEEDAHISSAMNPPEGDCYWFTTDGEDLTDDMPTHWMPLPDAPVIVPTGPANPECRNPEGCDRSHRMPSCRECSVAWLTLEPSERMRRRQEARAAA
ncbi:MULTISPECIES: DUF551 domain-containing protein [unclassified Aurantimonas]|uniref:DUF551 domain-containing protein n=1 Tax=unclassified Aurantimonas TaxID=2638230 RepID=UPI002E186D8C|nr:MULTISPECIES: DUF551 domain-containing protein [unclassified Aurantimonas]MEC5289421.1 DUF551 domain-containing protein [Aurantimonas sp. C2-3-R2]MEC5410501.1 DUF551 domain-containing protein [Aurantimonas sp. C2-4-R8]